MGWVNNQSTLIWENINFSWKGEPILIKHSNLKRVLLRRNFLGGNCGWHVIRKQEKGMDFLQFCFVLFSPFHKLISGTGVSHGLGLYFCSQMESVHSAQFKLLVGIFSLHLLQILLRRLGKSLFTSFYELWPDLVELDGCLKCVLVLPLIEQCQSILVKVWMSWICLGILKR